MPLNWANLEATVKTGALAGLNRAAALVEERAKQHAPVRHLFEGGSRKVRFKTMGEIKSDRDMRKVLGLGRERVAAPRTRLRSRRGMGKAKTSTLDTANANVPVFRIRTAGGLTPAATMRLHRRGGYEVKSGRADHNGMVGGRLRDEIEALPATGGPSRFEAMVVSPTPYAKYQEFGTGHNAAHPYLRPALHESRRDLSSLVKAGVRSTLRCEELRDVVEL